VVQGTAEKLIQHLVLHSPAADPTYVDDFLLTYRTFLKAATDVTSQLMAWIDEPAYTDKVPPQNQQLQLPTGFLMA